MNPNNFVLLTGHLGKDPEVRHFDTGGKVAMFSLATNNSYKNAAGEWVNQSTWNRIVAWNKLAELKLAKGDMISLQGHIVTREYTDKDDQKKSIVEINADSILKVDRPAKNDIPLPDEPKEDVWMKGNKVAEVEAPAPVEGDLTF